MHRSAYQYLRIIQACFNSNGTELKNYSVSEERWGWWIEGERSRTEEYSEYLPISPFSPSPLFYTPSLALFVEIVLC
jgi:hypothetical protein